jgi:hypothetical protein
MATQADTGSHLPRTPSGIEQGADAEPIKTGPIYSLFKRINPFQFAKAGKIRIRGGNGAAMFQGKGGNMSICHQVGDGLAVREHLLEGGPMLVGGPDDPGARLIQPALHAGQRMSKGQRIFKYPGVCTNPDECRQNRPAQANRSAAGKLMVPPFSSLLVLNRYNVKLPP